MSRQLVEALTRGIAHGAIADLNPVVTFPAPDEGVVYRDPLNGLTDITTDILPGMVQNLDDVPHTFNYFLRGNDVPGGGELNVNPLISLGAITTTPIQIDPINLGNQAIAAPFLPLVGDQRIEVEMQEVVNAAPPVFVQNWQDRYAPLDNLAVVPSVRGTKLATFNDGAPFVLDGPDDGFSTRVVRLCNAPPSNGTRVVNRDSVPHTITLTLRDLNANDQTLLSLVVFAGDTLLNAIFTVTAGAGFLMPGVLNLKSGQSLEIATATPTTDDDPWAWAWYEDQI